MSTLSAEEAKAFIERTARLNGWVSQNVRNDSNPRTIEAVEALNNALLKLGAAARKYAFLVSILVMENNCTAVFRSISTQAKLDSSSR
jgi:hypothetical protein